MEKGLSRNHTKEFGQRHKIVVALRAAGLRSKDIAEITDFTVPKVSTILNDPRGVALLKELSSNFIEQLTTDTQEVIQSHALEAAQANIELMRNAKSESVQQRSIFDILDRAGFKPRENTTQTRINVGAKDVARLITALEESKKEPEALEMVQDSSGVFREEDDVTTARK